MLFALRTHVLIKFIIYMVLFRFGLSVSSSTTTNYKFSDKSKETIVKLVYDDFTNANLFKTNATKSELIENLRTFQDELVKWRNARCIHDKHGHFDYSFVKYDLLNETLLFENGLTSKRLNTNTIDLNEYYNLTDRILFELNNKCINSSNLMNLFVNETNYNEDFQYLFKIVLTQLTNEGCDMCNKIEDHTPITKAESWGFGILFVSLINISSLCGVFVIPLSNKKIYKKLLMFLIAIAVGSLAGSGIIHLIPQAYGIVDDEKYAAGHDYAWKGVVIMCGIYLFYLVEKIMKLLILRRKLHNQNNIPGYDDSILQQRNSQILESIGYVKTHEPNIEPNIELRVKELVNYPTSEKRNHHGHSHGLDNLYSVAPVAWMIIFGDGLHNFIDGLSIGAAFSESILKGISICLAVVCEEFPHELGDFAILINSGMSYPVALLFNFLSACCCYVGLAVGITLGGNLGANKWIYAIAGGMFLYISLCDMIPELNEMGEEIERDYLEKDLNKLKQLMSINENDDQDDFDESKHTNDDDVHTSLNNNNNNDDNNNNNNKNTTTTSNSPSKYKGKYKKNQSKSSRNRPLDNSFIDEKIAKPTIKLKLKILVIQNIGMIFGFGFMLFMALYSENIKF